MAYDYDALYRTTPNALGAPTGVFVDFFQSLETSSLKVLDIGCGQGRDALFIARLGHHVTGVDLSQHGIADMTAAAKAEKLSITGIVGDLCDYDPLETFDIILIDRTLHMLDKGPRGQVLRRLLKVANDRARILIADEKSNLPQFRAIFDQDGRDWDITRDLRGYLFAQAT